MFRDEFCGALAEVPSPKKDPAKERENEVTMAYPRERVEEENLIEQSHLTLR
jgi:hypothetical protein